MSVTELTNVEGSSATDLLERGFNEWMLKFEGRGSREEGKNKIIPFVSFFFFYKCPLNNWELAIGNFQLPIPNSQLENIFFSDAPVAGKTLQINVTIVADKGFVR